jgi:hypothetical protein
MKIGGITFNSEEFRFSINPHTFEPMEMIFGDDKEKEEAEGVDAGEEDLMKDNDEQKIDDSVENLEEVNTHVLIEEMMVTANTIAASFTAFYFPHHALLRNHPPPEQKNIIDFLSELSKHGVEVEVGKYSYSTSEQRFSMFISDYLKLVRKTLSEEVSIVFEDVLRKNLQRAQYFCTGSYLDSGDAEDLSDRIVSRFQNGWGTNVSGNGGGGGERIAKDVDDIPPPGVHVLEWKHNALSLPLYTQFTSPIRRFGKPNNIDLVSIFFFDSVSFVSCSFVLLFHFLFLLLLDILIRLYIDC